MEKAVAEWLAMNPEDRLKANTFYKRHYEWALDFHSREGPPWEDLTHEQRDAVRQECIRYQQECDGLGDKIAEGKL